MEEYTRKSYRFSSGVGPKITTVPTTIGKYKPIEDKPKVKAKPNERKENSFSIFFITINTNLNFNKNTEKERAEKAELLKDVVDNMFGSDPGSGGNCDFLEFFKLVPGKYAVYANDDRDYETWCGHFKEIWIKASTEWSAKKENRRFLHCHAIVKVLHSTRIHLDKDAIAKYIKNGMKLNHDPYIHIDLVNPSLYYIMQYIQKDVDNPVESIQPESVTDDVIEEIAQKMSNLKMGSKYY